MKFLDEYRDPFAARALAEMIRSQARSRLRIMEFCGGHTHSILRHGIRQLLPSTIEMLSGPGCPVCVTSAPDIDRAVAIARIDGVILATFGDMVRVPGSHGSLENSRIQGADVRIVYSPLDALVLAQKNPGHPVIFLGIGFETTAPLIAASLIEACDRGIRNYFVLCLNKLTPPAAKAILDGGEVTISGILGPGHVTTIIGANAWKSLAKEYSVPIAIAGFEPIDILRAIHMLVHRVDAGEARVDNAYPRSVLPDGNPTALSVMDEVFTPCDAQWRGLGSLPGSGLRIREKYADYDASRAFPVNIPLSHETPGCRCGEVLRGAVTPLECPLFRHVCHPACPAGPCMVSAEGACMAYYQFGGSQL
ncbi:MAG: hydrogenase formation protein HypD [Syntrophorhabdus sp.]